MKSLSIVAVLVGTSFSFAQDSSTKENKEAAIERDVRFVITGSRPLPTFNGKGEKSSEVDPAMDLIPPTSIEILSGKDDKKASRKIPSLIAAPLNIIAPLPGLKSLSKIRLKLSRPIFESAPTQEIDCDLSDKIRPLIVISASPEKQAWKSPQLSVLEVDDKVFPARHVMFVNLSSIPLKVEIDGTVKAIESGANSLFRLAPGDEPARYRVDTAQTTGSITLANSAYRTDQKSRLILLAFPDPTAQGKANTSLRILTDSVSPTISTATEK
ncbi:MAG: hypothetical protein ABI600_06010 [Luteolibacter sp.]